MRTPSPNAPPEHAAVLLRIAEVAALLAVSARHLRRLADSGRMPAPVRLGASLRWRSAEVVAWIRDGCPAARRGER